MPYQGGNRLSQEKASKLGHLDVIKSELVNELVEQFETIDVSEVHTNAKWEEEFDQRFDPHGRRYFWMAGNFVNFDKGEDNDEWAIANNYVSIVPCMYDLTAHHAIRSINEDWDV